MFHFYVDLFPEKGNSTSKHQFNLYLDLFQDAKKDLFLNSQYQCLEIDPQSRSFSSLTHPVPSSPLFCSSAWSQQLEVEDTSLISLPGPAQGSSQSYRVEI